MGVISLADAARKSRGSDGKPLAQVSLRAAAERGALKARKNSKGHWETTDENLAKYLGKRPKWWKPQKR